MKHKLELVGGGGEPVDFARTLLSHGVADLLPNAVAQDGTALETVLLIAGTAWPVRVAADGPGFARRPAGAPADALATVIRHMLRLDDDLSAFYVPAAEVADARVGGRGRGRMPRSPTVFEDLVKTICTTNCTWSVTERMVGALVGEFGTPARARPSGGRFPRPPRWPPPARTSIPPSPRRAIAASTCARSPPTRPRGDSTSRA